MFVSEKSSVSTSLLEFAYLFCSELKAWILTLPEEDKAVFTLDQLYRRNLGRTQNKSSADVWFSPSMENQMLVGAVKRLFTHLMEDLEGKTDL